MGGGHPSLLPVTAACDGTSPYQICATQSWVPTEKHAEADLQRRAGRPRAQASEALATVAAPLAWALKGGDEGRADYLKEIMVPPRLHIRPES